MTIEHIVDAGYVVIEPYVDQLEDPTWMRAGSNDLLAYATPILGPTATLIVHRFGCYFEAGHLWHHFDLRRARRHLRRQRRQGPLLLRIVKAIGRIDRFGFGRLAPASPKLLIRQAIPPLSQRTARADPELPRRQLPLHHPVGVDRPGPPGPGHRTVTTRPTPPPAVTPQLRRARPRLS